MTRQINDGLILDGEHYALRGCPLEDYWEQVGANRRPDFPAIGSNCWRGYRAVWKVADGKLYLTSVGTGSRQEPGENGQTVFLWFFNDALSEVFPGAVEPVFADWVSGELIVSWGEVIDRPMRYSVVHEGYKILNIKAGHVESIEDQPSAWYYQRYDLPTPEQRQGDQR